MKQRECVCMQVMYVCMYVCVRVWERWKLINIRLGLILKTYLLKKKKKKKKKKIPDYWKGFYIKP